MNFNYKNANISYSIYGKGTAVVLLHGFLENSSMWKIIASQLSKKYRVICIDLLGHGKSENMGYIHTMEEQACMVKAVLNHLRLRKYVIIGHSMGGYIALAFAKLFSKNVKGIGLMNSTALPDTKEKKINRNRGISAVKQNYKTFVKLAIPQLFAENNRTRFVKDIKAITNEALKISPQGIIAALEGMKIREDLSYIYNEANYPIQMVIGKQDPALDYNSLIAQTKNTNVKVVEFPDGHMSHVENKEDLLRALNSFIKTCFYYYLVLIVL